MTLRFDPSEAIGPGHTVIEASAGTGKTFAIAATVARLVAIEGIGIDRILVITFTRAAKAELATRIRRRLVDTLSAIENHGAESDTYMKVVLGAGNIDRSRRRIGAALTSFDKAQIFTIHSFAHRMLGLLGFGGRIPAGFEVSSIDARLLAETAGDLVVARYANANGGSPRLSVETVAGLGRAVVSVPDARITPDLAKAGGVGLARVEMALAMRAEVAGRLRQQRRVTFDEGLVEVCDALEDPNFGPAARLMVGQSYEIGLIDESQDTDPMQWRVIKAVFADRRLVVIGDPKQSIYSFRGADVESYLGAAADAQVVRTLETNWRSDGQLIQALDVLLGGASFGDDRIVYRKVEAAPHHVAPRIAGVGAPLSLRWIQGDAPIPTRQDGVTFLIDPARGAVAADVAAEVVLLLQGGAKVDDTNDGERALLPSDIAVLCRTGRQVGLVRHELTLRGVPSVAGTSGTVFTSEAAEEWRRFLIAVEHPERIDRVRLGATTLMIGLSPQDVAALDDMGVVDIQTRMRRSRALLHSQGVPAMLADVDRSTGLTARVLGRPDGERVMTDINHIAEELHAAWRPGRIGSLVAWLEDIIRESQARETDASDELASRQRRLETDAEAVHVLTIHGAKGLEFPVVLVPFAWDVFPHEPLMPVFHGPDPSTGGRRRFIDVAGKGSSPDFTEHARLAQEEATGEEGRLLYVALTRARHHLVVWWVKNAPYSSQSKLGQILTSSGRNWAGLVEAAAGTIDGRGRSDLPTVERYEPANDPGTSLHAASFNRQLDHVWRRASFSSLSPEHPLPAEVSDLRVDEVIAEEDERDPGLPVADTQMVDLPLADLPKGARFGTLVHDILEAVGFNDPDLAGSIRTALAEAIKRSGWDFDVDAFVTGMAGALTTPLGPEPDAPTLAAGGRMLKELTFEFPVRSGDVAVSLADLGAVMNEHLPNDDVFQRYAARLGALGEQRFRGFLTGAIDLTLEMPDGRFVVIDYKSNALGDYGPEGLSAAMIEGNYVLQSTLYQVALHRYLCWRLPGYDAATHLGGSIYLFIRGTNGPATAILDGARSGVHIWRPPAAMILALSDLFEAQS